VQIENLNIEFISAHFCIY